MPLNARRETLMIVFTYHSLLELDKSGKTLISPSIDHGKQIKEKKVKTGRKELPLTSRRLSDP